MIDTAASQELTADEVDDVLSDVLAELAEMPLDDAGRMAWFAAAFTLRVRAGEEGDDELRQAYRDIPSKDLRCRAAWELASAHVVAGRLQEAETIAHFALEDRGTSQLTPRLWHVRAEAARLRGQWDRALQFLDRLEKGLPDATPSDPEQAAELHEVRSRLYQTRAQVLIELGLLDRARELAVDALEEARASGRPSPIAAALLLAFDQALMSSDSEGAIELARAARKDAELAPWHPLFSLYEGLATVGEVREAAAMRRETAETAARARASFDAAQTGQLSRSERLKLELGRCDLELCLGRTPEAGVHLARAREAAGASLLAESREAVRLAALAWRLAGAAGAPTDELERARDELFDAHDSMLQQWDSTPRLAGGIGFLHLAWRAQVLGDVLDAELERAAGPEGVERAFGRLLAAQAMGTLARERGLGPPTIADVRGVLLAPRRGLLVLLPARDGSHLFVLDESSLAHHAIPVGRDALRDAAGRVTSALARPDGVLDRAALAALQADLLPRGAREALARWDAAVTIGFELLRDLPFGLLADEKGRPYGERLALVTLPSISLGLDLARHEAEPEEPALDVVLVVAGDPPPELALAPFRFGQPERERLLAPFAPDRVEVLEGARATLGGLREARDLLRGARVVHFLAHGTRVPGRESPAALVLSAAGDETERLLTAEDVVRLPCGGLVILSACGSGRGPLRMGDDRLMNLGGAFLDAGARCVVLARFPVEYEATLALMERFHARLAAGDPPAEALRAARAGGGHADGPADLHAAAFEVLGLGFEPVFPRR